MLERKGKNKDVLVPRRDLEIREFQDSENNGRIGIRPGTKGKERGLAASIG